MLLGAKLVTLPAAHCAAVYCWRYLSRHGGDWQMMSMSIIASTLILYYWLRSALEWSDSPLRKHYLSTAVAFIGIQGLTAPNLSEIAFYLSLISIYVGMAWLGLLKDGNHPDTEDEVE